MESANTPSIFLVRHATSTLRERLQPWAQSLAQILRLVRSRTSRVMGVITAVTLMVTLQVATVRPARAADLLEPPRARQGYYVALGYSFQTNHVWEDKESWGVWTGGNLSVRIGEMVTRRFGLGLQFNSGATKGNAQTATLSGLELEAQFEVARNLALLGAAGLDVVSLSSDNGMDKTTRGTVGSGYSLALAYDWFFTHRLTGGWALTPTLTARYVPGDTASSFAGLLGLQISYWTGLPRNQLDLPPGEAFKKE